MLISTFTSVVKIIGSDIHKLKKLSKITEAANLWNKIYFTAITFGSDIKYVTTYQVWNLL